MKLKSLGEFALIERLSKKIKKGGRGVVVGVGDDAAVLRVDGDKLLVATTDTIIEGVHFDLKSASYYDIGWKALCSNISDCASMGAAPRHVLVTLGLPPKVDVEDVDELYRGMGALARKFKINIVGGDTISSPKALVISLTLLGEVRKKNLILRSGARAGDLILVTGKLGASSAGLKQQPRVKEALAISKSRLATSMIDNSDGLARGVIEICRMSGVGARIKTRDIPRTSSLDLALYGGEDYELVFTAPKSKAQGVKGIIRKASVIGEIVDKRKGIKLVDDMGRERKLKSGGYEHFNA